MKDNSHHDDIIRGSSPEVMRRLLGYLKSYKLVAALTLPALILATGAELLSPLVMKRALDDYVLRREYRVNTEYLENIGSGDGENAALSESLISQGTQIGKYLFISSAAFSKLGENETSAARSAGWLDEREWYLFTGSSNDIAEIIATHPGIFLSEKGNHAILLADLNALESWEKHVIRKADIDGLGRSALIYLVLLVAVLVFTFAQVYSASWISQKVMADMRGALLSHTMRQSLKYLGRTPVGSLVSRTANDVETISEFFTNVTISFLKDIAIMVGVIIAISILDTRLTLIAITTLIPTFVLIVIFRNQMRESFRKVRSRISAVNTYLSERLSGMGTLQLFDAQKRSSKEFREKGEGLLSAELGQMRIMAVFRPLVELIASTAVALIIWYSADLHDRGLVTLGVLIAFVDLIQKFFQPVKDIAEKFNILQSAMAGGERVFELLGTVDRIPDDGAENSVCSIEDNACRIRFTEVHFSYVPGEPVLCGLDFDIEPGKTLAIVGATGAGKTTIANLLTRLWDVDQGQILLNDRDVRNYPLADLRRAVQPVQQDVFLFGGSIAYNIDLNLGLSREQIEGAARISRADAFIRNLPEGYDTVISEGASNLSAGQRQLIAFARIIAYNPKVIILDEATANVDTETETLLQEGLEHILENRTALIIAHRLSTIRKADRIIVLGHGRLIEEGTHAELLDRQGVYRNLYELQFAEG